MTETGCLWPRNADQRPHGAPVACSQRRLPCQGYRVELAGVGDDAELLVMPPHIMVCIDVWSKITLRSIILLQAGACDAIHTHTTVGKTARCTATRGHLRGEKVMGEDTTRVEQEKGVGAHAPGRRSSSKDGREGGVESAAAQHGVKRSARCREEGAWA